MTTKWLYILTLCIANTCCILLKAQTQPSIIINEVMVSNIDVYLDPSQNFGSWVELYNPSSEPINLGGLYVSNDQTNLKQHRLVNDYGILPPWGYAILNFDHHDNFTKEGFRQIDDKLDCDGGIIIISDGSTIFSQFRYPISYSRISYARISDGASEWSYTGNPTPGFSNNDNNGFAKIQLPAPSPSLKSCLFSAPLTVTVDIPTGVTLRYTTDGTCPTLTNGITAQSTTFNIKETTCYRFRFFQEGLLPSQVVTRSYIKDDGNHPFPIISLVTDTTFFYDKNYGLFEIGPYGRAARYTSETYNSNMDWDRPVSFEYITTDNECVVSQECDFSMTGGWSRMVSPHSFKLKAKKQYDFHNSFDYQFFTEKPYLKHKTLLIRNGGDDQKFRVIDVAFQQMIAKSGIRVNYQSFEPVQIFINGCPYAVLNLREPNNKDFAFSNYGLDSDELDQFEMSPDSGYIQMRGTKDAFNQLLELSKNSAQAYTYESIRKLLDIDDFINYIAIQLYIGNSDFPFNNVKGFRDRKDGKFHFVLFDLDGVFNPKSPFEYFFGMETYQFDPLYGYDYSRDENLSEKRMTLPIELVTLFRNLLQNPNFRKQFIDTICIVGGSVFKQDRVTYVMDELNSRMTLGNLQDPTTMTNYFKLKMSLDFNLARMIQLEECPQMCLHSHHQKARITSDTPGSTITLNDIEIPYCDFDGFLYGPITLQAISPKGFQFIGWKNVINNEILSTSSCYTLPESDTLDIIACFNPQQSTLDNFAIRINEISANNSVFVNDYYKKNDWIELYNTSSEAVDVAGMYLSDDSTNPYKYKIPNSSTTSYSTLIPPHGYLIIWADVLSDMHQPHCGFKLGNRNGESITLTSADGHHQDVLEYCFQDRGTSFGRYPDGCDETYIFNVPTIGKRNLRDSYSQPIDISGIPGDVNKDGLVDISDIVSVINHISGKSVSNRADVNKDGNVDISDIVSIIHFISSQ